MELRKYMSSNADEIVRWIKDERALKLWSADIYDKFPISADDINNNYNKYMSYGNFYPMTLIDNGKIVGHIILRNPDIKNINVVRLVFIIINDTLRGKGYGKLLIHEAIKYAKLNLNAKEINLGVFENNESAYCCYKSVGFKKVRIDIPAFRFYDEVWNCVEMVLAD